MLQRISCALPVALLAVATVAGCGTRMNLDGLMEQQAANIELQSQDRSSARQKQRLMQDVMKNPDTPQWHEQRQKIVMGLGDRVFDKSFNRVFDSMTVALATLECKVENMERASGYITASLPGMPPQQRDGLRAEALRDFAASKGYPPDLLDKPRKKADAGQRQRVALVDVDDLDFESATMGMLDQYYGGVTLSLVRQSATQTKVKLRFDKVYYPPQVQEYYRMVWAAVDKQIFLDQALD